MLMASYEWADYSHTGRLLQVFACADAEVCAQLAYSSRRARFLFPSYQYDTIQYNVQLSTRTFRDDGIFDQGPPGPIES
jgi:hypothetical protein